MPWKQGPVEERRRMIQRWEEGATPTELAGEFGVSRQSVYEWIAKWREYGDAGLEEQSRTPHSNARQTAAEVVHALLDMKDRHPTYGPDKLVRLLTNEGISLNGSTARDILKRNGRVKARRARVTIWSPTAESKIVVPGPGHSMSADHKGQFRMGNGSYCFPLTIAEPASRFVFAVQGGTSTNGEKAKPVFIRVFREWGVPEQMITDNGPPFCVSQSIGGLSQLGKWWIKLRIHHARIKPGRPQQNGIHERMHRTLNQLCASPPEQDHRPQQRRFNAFRLEFNHVRPHQALGQDTPASRVQKYRRPYPERLPKIEYPASFETRYVHSNGCIKWKGEAVFVGEVLVGEWVALTEHENDRWQLYFGPRHLADWDPVSRKFKRSAQPSYGS